MELEKIYTCDTKKFKGFIFKDFKRGGTAYLCQETKTFCNTYVNWEDSNERINIREANEEQSLWLEECIKKGVFIPREQISLNYEIYWYSKESVTLRIIKINWYGIPNKRAGISLRKRGGIPKRADGMEERAMPF